MSATAIEEYLSQVAPVPFSPEFSFAAEIRHALEPVVKLGNFVLRISGVDGPIYRPHRRRPRLAGFYIMNTMVPYRRGRASRE
jgi:hypothetical protein